MITRPLAGSPDRRRPRTILLRSAWQTTNIGDIAHTPGVLRLLEQHLPEATVILWPGRLDRGVEPLLRRRFPGLRIVRNGAHWHSPDPRPDDPTVEQAIEEADLMLHGSGSGLPGQVELQRWRQATEKPYGAYGVTTGSVSGSTDGEPRLSDELRRLLQGAAFLFTRETTSLEVLRRADIRGPHLDFAPDGTFALDLRDDAAAERLMQRAGLEADRFICAVPRLRITPYWEIYPERGIPPEEVAWKQAVNEAHAESDHAKLREVIISWARETGQKALLCPEMTYQLGLLRPLLFDRLPEDVKPNVVTMDRFWLTDEAASVYCRARAVVSMECHSPIIANANGRPGFYLRQPTDTWKGQMYPDLGLGDWKFDLDTATGRQIAERLLQVHAHYDAALVQVRGAANRATERFAQTMGVVRSVLER
jgi:hypothetical protein